MPRPVFGRVRKQIYDTSTKVGIAAGQTADVAQKSILEATKQVLLFLARGTEVFEEILDDCEVEIDGKAFGWQLPINIRLKIKVKEEEDA